jgi:hypothetical protein
MKIFRGSTSIVAMTRFLINLFEPSRAFYRKPLRIEVRAIQVDPELLRLFRNYTASNKPWEQ